jgi:hypothetical protein
VFVAVEVGPATQLRRIIKVSTEGRNSTVKKMFIMILAKLTIIGEIGFCFRILKKQYKKQLMHIIMRKISM